MLYYIDYKNSFIKSLLKYHACKKTSERYEIYVFGEQIMNSAGKSTWNGTGPARNAFRLILSDVIGYGEKKKVDAIMKSYVGLDDSYPIHIKKI